MDKANMWNFVFLLSMFILPLCASPEPLINNMHITQNSIHIVVHPTFKNNYLKEHFFVTYDEDIDIRNIDSSILVVPFLLNVITIVWASGKQYIIPSLDADIYQSLQKIKKVFQRIYPRTSWSGEVIPHKIVSNKPKIVKSAVAQMFSNGLDSLCTALSHRDDTDFFCVVKGHADTPLHDNNAWAYIQHACQLYAQQYGASCTFITSNYYRMLHNQKLRKLSPEITHWRTAAVEGLGWFGLVAPLLICKNCTKLRIASSISWDCPFVHAANPFIDNNLRCAGIVAEHDGFEYSRVQKCEQLKYLTKTYNLPKPVIRVCQNKRDGTNCGICMKCIQTIYGLWAVEEDHTAYGFAISKSAVHSALQKLLKNKFSRFKVWHFTCIQQMLQKNVEWLPLDDHMRWFMTYNFLQHVRSTTTKHSEIDWRTCMDLLDDKKE